MKKTVLLFLLITIGSMLLMGFMYLLIAFLDYRSSLSNLQEYSFSSNEKVIKEFSYYQYNYVITKYYDDTSSWSHLRLLLQDHHKSYILKSIEKCDTSDDSANLYIKKNEVYIHCIGQNGNIDKYTIKETEVEKEILNFRYDDTPNISKPHILIDKVDEQYIYLSSPFKVDNTVSDLPQVKCSFQDQICVYYSIEK